MASAIDRKEAIRKFKERKTPRGAFAVRCRATGRVWVGASRNLDAARNGAWFCLRQGGYYDKSLQAEWNAQGEAAFEYEVLERIEDDVAPLAVPDLLKETAARWVERLGARLLP